ncbi:MAG: hypothetical protein C0481_02840 [Phenylobacterium sp.]|uniref:hypothetical protein n=1 Tax=Phenylobacterium sp. TaxID=1871053 RepID=UPI0025E31730|nr:hypothetical protein [Phenylobacterium sp.]MBA4010781.1 hypothetical protein [Phenylobacterium sp.]
MARADPIVTVDRRTEFVCPTQLDAPIAAKPAPPEGSMLEGSPAALGWVGELARWGDDLAGRISAAQDACRDARK